VRLRRLGPERSRRAKSPSSDVGAAHVRKEPVAVEFGLWSQPYPSARQVDELHDRGLCGAVRVELDVQVPGPRLAVPVDVGGASVGARGTPRPAFPRGSMRSGLFATRVRRRGAKERSRARAVCYRLRLRTGSASSTRPMSHPLCSPQRQRP
jgi:hypothetical protein